MDGLITLWFTGKHGNYLVVLSYRSVIRKIGSGCILNIIIKKISFQKGNVILIIKN